ncbi:MAG: NTP transferase domain-containing protein [Kiritimatiellae bacterium]|nr:NTP transferase domain-containing protein [Kiritimatiellia bacterium]
MNAPQKLPAIVLLGGAGTRLRKLFPDLPKALVPVAGRPFLQWQIEWLAQGGVERVHLAAGYKAAALHAHLESEISNLKSEISLSEEPEPLGTAGGLRFAAEQVAGDAFLVVNGDSLLPNLDFQALEKTAAIFPRIGKMASAQALATLAVTRIEESGRYGTVEFDGTGLVRAFREKADHSAGWINGGVYLVCRSVLDRIEPGRNLSLETDIFPALAREGRLKAHECPPPLLDMGTPNGLRAMEDYLQQQQQQSGGAT